MKILLDTDIGSDIDDALCLAYLLANPECELLGVTTVTGQAHRRAQLASALCRAADVDVPIYPGAETPLFTSQNQPHVPQARVLDRWDHAESFKHGAAIGFLRETIRRHPGKVTLVAIGPLTNIALLFGVDSELPQLLHAFVAMGGRFYSGAGLPLVEWNIGCDPYAAAIVYRTQTAVHRSIGLDVTTLAQMPRDAAREAFQSRLLQPVLDCAAVWFERRDMVTFHDPLAAATLFDDRICGFEKGNVEVELQSATVQGLTHWRPDSAHGQHEVASTVGADAFFDHFMSVLQAR